MTLSEVVNEGDQLKSLIALRDFIADELEKGDQFCSKCRRSPSIAALSKQLTDILERISLIQPLEKSKIDELAERRANRRRDIRRSDSAHIVEPPCAN